MLAHVSMWVLAAALGQAPAEAAWLKTVPADVDVVVRVRGLEVTANNLVAMVKAMSPAWGKMAEEAVANPLAMIREKHGEAAVKAPWVGLVRVVPPEDGGLPPFAILLMADDYKGVLKALSGGKDAELKPQNGGYDSFDGPEGAGTWYATKGSGFIAFGPAKDLIAAIANPGEKTLDKVMTPGVAKPFLSGDAGVYVNAAALTTRYADQIEQARQTFMTAMDQAGQQAGNAASMKFVKDFYSNLFDSLKYADVSTLGLDLAPEGLHLAGALRAKPDSDAAKRIASASTGSADLTRFPTDAGFYVYMNLDAKTFDKLQGLGLRMMNAGGKSSPKLDEALKRLHSLGQVETRGAATFTEGMQVLNDINISDPKKYIEASISILEAMKGGEGFFDVYKDVKVERDAKTYEGFTFTHLTATLDMVKLAQLGGNNPGGAGAMKSILGDGIQSSWLGTDGKQLLHVSGRTWDEAKAKVDAYLKGASGIGSTPGYKAVRSQLPERASLLALVNTQGLVQILATQLATVTNNPDLKAPADLPKEPALFGMSLTPQATGSYEFHLVLPSSVGPVVEKGFIPLFQGLKAPGVAQ